MAAIKIKRVYDESSPSDGYRIFVDRLWPRGVKKTDLHVDEWLKEVGPSNGLRKWFNHEVEKWQEFSKEYAEELKTNSVFWDLKKIVKDHKTVTLVYGAKDEKHNQAVVLKELLKT